MLNNRIKFTISDITINAVVRNTVTGKAILDALPIHSHAQTWGEEVYFSVPVETDLEGDAKDVVNAGEIAFWVEGSCIAIGFGPTPISQGNEIRLAAKTNIWADAEDGVRQLISVQSQDPISIERG